MPPVVAVFTKNNTNPAYAAARLAADLVAGEAGARTIHYVPETPDDVGQQKVLVERALKLNPTFDRAGAAEARALLDARK